ncbi:hypothetical protein, partial [Chloroflexus sp.]|uniref:hypothetical protein n=1 Tax=Chloroflexus sp. TaxID=1904827 RepID=UPI003C7417A0
MQDLFFNRTIEILYYSRTSLEQRLGSLIEAPFQCFGSGTKQTRERRTVNTQGAEPSGASSLHESLEHLRVG